MLDIILLIIALSVFLPVGLFGLSILAVIFLGDYFSSEMW